MLVLSRKLNEQISIGNDITVTIVKVRGKAVGIGIEAPRDVRIVRAELSQRENANALADEATCQVVATCRGGAANEAQVFASQLEPEATGGTVVQRERREPPARLDDLTTLQILLARRQRRRHRAALPR